MMELLKLNFDGSIKYDNSAVSKFIIHDSNVNSFFVVTAKRIRQLASQKFLWLKQQHFEKAFLLKGTQKS